MSFSASGFAPLAFPDVLCQHQSSLPTRAALVAFWHPLKRKRKKKIGLAELTELWTQGITSPSECWYCTWWSRWRFRQHRSDSTGRRRRKINISLFIIPSCAYSYLQALTGIAKTFFFYSTSWTQGSYRSVILHSPVTLHKPCLNQCVGFEYLFISLNIFECCSSASVPLSYAHLVSRTLSSAILISDAECSHHYSPVSSVFFFLWAVPPSPMFSCKTLTDQN